MFQSYIQTVPLDRQSAILRLIQICDDTLMPLGFSPCIQYKMPSRVVSKSDYPAWYHCDPTLALPFVSLANQKWSINLYHLWVYNDPNMSMRLQKHYPLHSTHKLDMGKSCIRFKYIDDIPYDLIKQLLEHISAQKRIQIYEQHIKK